MQPNEPRDEAEAAERDRLVALIEHLKAEQAQALARLQVQAKRLSSENASLKKQLAAMLSSRSWKLVRKLSSLPRAFAPKRKPQPTSGTAPVAPAPVAPAPAAQKTASDLSTPAPTPAPAPDATLPEAPPPEFSVVIPAYKNLALTQLCVESIYASGGDRTFEVVVVDNASGDGTKEWLRAEANARPSLVVVENERNLGFAGGVNAGVRAARGSYIVVCNNDVAVTERWLDKLAESFDGDPALGILSPVTNYVGEGPQLDMDALEATAETRAEFGRRAEGRDASLVPVVDRLVFFCVAVRRSVYDVLGGLSEDFGLGNYEDDDFCVRARMSGATLAVDPRVFVFHQGSATWAAAKISHTKWMERNRGVYFNKLAHYAVGPAAARRRSPSADPLASVVVRTVDRPRLLREALTSLVHQTLDDFEVVVVNDGGPDIGNLLEEFTGRLAISYVHHPEGLGRVAALNAGLKSARAPRVTYLDDDDIAYPLHLEVLLDRARTSSYPVVYADANISLWRMDGDRATPLARRTLTPFEYDPRELLVRNRIPIQSMMHDASAAAELGGFDESLDLLEDWDFLIRLSKRNPFLRVPRVTSEFRFRVGDRIENSILARRDEIIDVTGLVYKRHPVEQDELEDRRREFIRELKRQAEELASIRASSGDGAALDIAVKLCGFRPAG